MGVHPQHVNKYLSGELSVDGLVKSLLKEGCDIEWLMTGEKRGAFKVNDRVTKFGGEPVPMTMIPFLGKITATPEGKEYFEELKGFQVPFFPGNYFALEIENDSMISAEPIGLNPGDIVVFEAGRQPKSGMIVAVQFKQSHERTVKMLYHKSATEIELRSANKFRPYPIRSVKKNQIESFGVFVTKMFFHPDMKKKFGLPT